MPYRIRIGKNYFIDPHYITHLKPTIGFGSIKVNKNPINWVKKSTAQKHLSFIQETFNSAEIEEYFIGDS